MMSRFGGSCFNSYCQFGSELEIEVLRTTIGLLDSIKKMPLCIAMKCRHIIFSCGISIPKSSYNLIEKFETNAKNTIHKGNNVSRASSTLLKKKGAWKKKHVNCRFLYCIQR